MRFPGGMVPVQGASLLGEQGCLRMGVGNPWGRWSSLVVRWCGLQMRAHASLEMEVLPMFMNATILDAEVNAFFDGVKANVYDLDEKQTYEALIVDGLLGLPELPELLELKRQKPPAPSDLLVQAAAQVEMPPLMQPLPVFVKRIRLNKGFMKLVCRLAPAQ